MRILSVLVCCLAFFASVSAQQTIPSAQVKTLDGKTVDLKSFVREGEITVISFWATWCSPCKKELDNMMDLYEDWKKEYKVHIIAISVDDARTSTRVKGTVDAKGWPYTVLLDPNQDLQRLLNFQTVPQTFLVNQKGEIIYSHSGYKEGDELHLEDKIKAAAKQ